MDVNVDLMEENVTRINGGIMINADVNVKTANVKLAALGWPPSATNILNRILDLNNHIKTKFKQNKFSATAY